MTQVQWRSCNINHNQRDQNLQKKRPGISEQEPEVGVRYVVSVECLIHPKNAQCGAKSVINVEIRIILVLNAGPSSWEEGTDDPTAHPEDVRAKANISSPGLEATR